LTRLLISLALVCVHWQEHNLLKTTVHKCLQKYGLYPYQPQQVQTLQPGDREHCSQFGIWLVERANEDADFVLRVLWTDGSHFAQMGIVNTHNIHHWAHENPNSTRRREHQVHWSLNMWIGLLGDCIIGPHLLPERLTAATYYTFIDCQYCCSTFLWPPENACGSSTMEYHHPKGDVFVI
jgi:hypothetical protein